MIGRSYVLTLPYSVSYAIGDVIYLGQEHHNDVVKVVYANILPDTKEKVYFMRTLFWRTLYRKVFGVLL